MGMIKAVDKQRRYQRMFRWTLVLGMLVLVLPLLPYAYQAGSQDPVSALVPSPGGDLWRAVRQREAVVIGSTQVQGVDAGVLINAGGEEWRQYRMNTLIPYSAYLLSAVLIAIIAFRLFRGRVPIQAGRSDVKIPRFTLNQRTVHWIVAGLFVLLGLTGIVLLYGRFVLVPLFGLQGFSVTADIAKRIHDFAGPAFGVALIIQFVLFVRGNMPDLKTDIQWFRNGGGLFGKHASAGRYNAGEKLWFWLAMLGGIVIVFSGLVLDFPIFEQSRQTMALSHLVHSIAAVIVLAGAFGHIYMGTIAMEGAFEAMATGDCDANWAREHHDIWFKEMQESGFADVGLDSPGSRSEDVSPQLRES